MPVTTRQLLRLIHVIEQRFDLTNREKEELLSILDDPSEADESLESGYFDWLFPRATVKVSSSDGAQKWELQIGPHAQIEAVLDNIHLDDLIYLFQRFLDKVQAHDVELVETKYVLTASNARQQLISIVVYVRDDQTARVATTYLGRPQKPESGGRFRI